MAFCLKMAAGRQASLQPVWSTGRKDRRRIAIHVVILFFIFALALPLSR